MFRTLFCGVSIVFAGMLQGCSEHAERDVPKARGRKKGSSLTSCDIYLGSTSPFTIATYEGPGDGEFHLTSATCGSKKSAAHVMGSSAASRPINATDCDGLQIAEREQYAAGKGLDSLYEECDGHGKVETAVKDNGSVEKDESAAKLKDGMMTYRTVSIYVKDLDDSNSGAYHISGGAYSYSSGSYSSSAGPGEARDVNRHP
ncbi:hypothetical protein FOZ60_012225 [Perkinsus olseni]|uniref:Uncharacterized protein n=1 Tax=Perkinsus olseni TaxID=32597 RepID=A0A7J6NBW9_PEROL|nr:hypothetical protein FOZ60_012225 [Perkinsus olseni]